MTFDARPDRGIHVATIAHVGRIWDAFLEFDGDPHRPDVYRGRLRFEVANASEGEAPVRTAVRPATDVTTLKCSELSNESASP